MCDLNVQPKTIYIGEKHGDISNFVYNIQLNRLIINVLIPFSVNVILWLFVGNLIFNTQTIERSKEFHKN
jgi:hypothetical protein